MNTKSDTYEIFKNSGVSLCLFVSVLYIYEIKQTKGGNLQQRQSKMEIPKNKIVLPAHLQAIVDKLNAEGKITVDQIVKIEDVTPAGYGPEE